MMDEYVKLAAAILSLQYATYNMALKNWARRGEWVTCDSKVERIEDELLSGYYQILTFGKVDFRQYINDMRRKHHLPEKKYD